MIYQGQEAQVKTLDGKDIVALGKAIESLNKEIIDIKISSVQETEFNYKHFAVVITKP